MRKFVRDHRFHFFAIHQFEQARRHGHERARLRGPSRKSVGFALIDTDFGHGQIGLGALTTDYVNQPRFEPRIRTVRVDHRKPHAHLRHGFAHEERNDRTRKTYDHGEDEKGAEIEILPGHGAKVDTEDHLYDRKNDRKHHKDGEVGQQEKAETLQHNFSVFDS